jgi:cytosine/adenosine deaminase-related metal-dependent hydrolase
MTASAAIVDAPAQVFSAPWVLPVVRPPIRDGAVAVDAGGTILAVGPRAEVLDALGRSGGAEVHCEGALVPGLVNAHTHLELSWLAGAVPGGDGVIAWTRRLMEKVTAAPATEDARFAAAAAAARAARALGTAALGDVGNGILGWRAMADARILGLFFHELVGSRERRIGDALGDAAAERATVPEPELAGASPLIPAVPAPHAPYSVGPGLIRRIFAAAAAAGLPTTIHLAEDPDEVALLADGSGGWPDVLRAMGVDPGERAPGLGPCAYLAELGALAARDGSTGPAPLLVHMVCAGPDDRRRAREAGATVVLCPRSNLHIGGRLPDIAALVHDGVALALGTDSLASAPDLSLWGEMRALSAAVPEIPARRWLEAATDGGARALGLGATLGALERARRPGLLCVDGAMGPGEREPERALISNAEAPSIRWLVPAAGPRGAHAATSAGAAPVVAPSPRPPFLSSPP